MVVLHRVGIRASPAHHSLGCVCVELLSESELIEDELLAVLMG
jgi:hypothetical protein